MGPLVGTDSGYQYILVVADYATWYLEAVPLHFISAPVVTKELVQLFSWAGIPKEILNDHGTNFMSGCIQQLYKWLKICSIRTSVYHPQTDGLVNLFNQTLKQMLCRFLDKEKKNWAKLLSYMLFAVHEVRGAPVLNQI